jgi:hypothetical protein
MIVSPIDSYALVMIFQFNITYGSSYMLSPTSVKITAIYFHCLIFLWQHIFTYLNSGLAG